MTDYTFRGLPCNILPDADLWVVCGTFDGVSGVLEWCYNSDDAEYLASRMRLDSRCGEVCAESWQRFIEG